MRGLEAEGIVARLIRVLVGGMGDDVPRAAIAAALERCKREERWRDDGYASFERYVVNKLEIPLEEAEELIASLRKI
jgi:hypothetical protein